MKYCDDFSIREIADIFKISESAAKMRLLRAREKLRSKFEGPGVYLGYTENRRV
jgi:DNA-directed RNA polymerase specialized sigma24 family protein